MKEKIILSTVSAWELGDQFDSAQAQKNEALREAKVAKLDGDLSENAPYQAAKEKFRTMGRIQRRLTGEMDHLLKEGHRLVDPLTWVNDSAPEAVELGAVVVIDLDGEREKFLVAGARDHHVPNEGDILPIPYTSPLGHALIGKHAKESFNVTIRETVRSVHVHSIRRPNRDEILAIFPALKEE
ncbi:MAG TPA: GreA/GreB family elongation factor [Chthoniobacterales bacterium]|nr:GreA/GreB family elongation factor [Chthoniobacterales bacterium]